MFLKIHSRCVWKWKTVKQFLCLRRVYVTSIVCFFSLWSSRLKAVFAICSINNWESYIVSYPIVIEEPFKLILCPCFLLTRTAIADVMPGVPIASQWSDDRKSARAVKSHFPVLDGLGLCPWYRYLPLNPNMDKPNSQIYNSKSEDGNHTPISHMLICLLNSSFT